MKDPEEPGRDVAAPPLQVGEFLDQPTRDLNRWGELWRQDLRFPIHSHRGGPIAAALTALKRLLRPVFKTPVNDLWDRQRVFNQIVTELLQGEQEQRQQLEVRVAELGDRVRHVETLVQEGLDEVMRYGDALYTRVDQKLEGARLETRDLLNMLRLARDSGGEAPESSEALGARLVEARYVELERRHRGPRELVLTRVRQYLEDLTDCSPVLDLGCGRGEALEVLREAGLTARGVDSSAEMVRCCRELGLAAERGDVLAALRAQDRGTVGGVVSFHVIEHLPWQAVDELVDLAWRALRPGGVLVLETPNAESIAVAASRFWVDPTHLRPIHPERMRTLLEATGFETEIRPCQPFGEEELLPELEPSNRRGEIGQLVLEMNRLRDRVNDLLFGYQDFAAIGRKP